MVTVSIRSVLILVFGFVSMGPVPSQQNQYCAITPQHTLCQFQGIGPRCKTPIEIGIPPEDRRLIMEMHNGYRSRVASGKESRGRPGPQPTAANMRELVWDDELALTAQRLTDQCKYTHDCLECRKVSRFLTGQNLYQFSENIVRPKSDWRKAIDAWYDEVAQWSPSHITYFNFIKPLGHYTQMVWADTDRMGCGYAFYNDGKWNRKLYICNYGSAGNIITTPMYQIGTPCSNCPEGSTCSSRYPGLCTESRGSSAFFPTQSFQTQATTRRTTTPPPPPPTTTTKQPINYIESNDLFETRSNFPKRNSQRFFYETINNTSTGNYRDRFSFVPTSSARPTRSSVTTTTNQAIDFTPRTQSPTRDGATATISRIQTSTVSKVTDMNSILIFCDFDFAKCPIRFTGASWNYSNTGLNSYGRGFEVDIPPGGISNLYVRSLMSPENDGQICLSFRYIKYPLPSAVSQATFPASVSLRVTAGTLNQRPKIVEINDNSASVDDWLTAKVQFDGLQSNFLLIFQVPRNSLQQTLRIALDDILVTKGRCLS